MKMLRALLWVFLAVALVGNSSVATSATMPRLDLKYLSTQSQSVVVGKVERIESRWEDDHREIYTYITLRIGDRVKGAKAGETVTIRQLGGVVGDIGSMVPGTARFREGEEVLVFLTRNDPTGHPWVYGLQQGKFTIRTDAEGRRTVHGNVDELKLVGPSAASHPGAAVPLHSFLARVRGYMGSPNAPTPVE